MSAVAIALGAMSLPASAVTASVTVKDLGAVSSSSTRTFTVGLAMRNAAALDPLLESISNPTSPSFRKFLTPEQFTAQFGQTDAAVAQVVSYLQSVGMTVVKVHPNNLILTVNATNAQVASVFGAPIHAYLQGSVNFEAPTTDPVIPAALSGVVSNVAGLSNRPLRKSRRVNVPNAGVVAKDTVATTATPSATAPATNVPGSYTVADLAAKYNINPLYAKGYTGAGKTIGIATLAAYYQSDVYAYWASLGLNVSSSRITNSWISGGYISTPGSEGAQETTLDIEQAGGVAPGANIRVYIAPNTDQGFIDLFSNAVNDNVVDVLSVSWGSPEINYTQSTLSIYHTIFQQAAAQGIPVIASAGDAGSYDINTDYPYPSCSHTVSVDFPASDPYVLAAGGTTLPNSWQHTYGVVTVPTERAWSWDYLKSYITTHYSQSEYYADYIGVGGGGGVSVYSIFNVPSYQAQLPGVQTSAPAQALVCGPAVTDKGYEVETYLPPGLTGRNVPDVSLNADPYSGYSIYVNGAFASGSGGTSFVAPQLNGILTLISQGIASTSDNPHGRIGMPATQLYQAFRKVGYGTGSPFKAITAGGNGYYQSTATYNPATGLGSLDVDALATTLGAVAPN